MARVLVVQQDPHEDAGRLPVALTEAALGWDIHPAWRTPLPEAPRHDALVLLGGPMGVHERGRYPFLRTEMDLARRFLEAGRPVLGICLGAQLLAATFGGRIRPAAGLEAGWQRVELTPAGARDPVLGALAAAPAVFQWHEDAIDPPPRAEVLALSPAGTQAFRLGRALGLQFHPETTPEAAAAWASRDAAWLRARGLDPEDAARAPAGAGAAAERLLGRLALFLDGRA